MTDQAKATVWQATWKPWGEPHTISGTVPNNSRFPSQYFQLETGLHYNWHRTYDPVTGRYTQPDPLRFVDGPSIYAYAGNSPYMYTDREGLVKKYVKPKNRNQKKGAEDRQPGNERERNVKPPDGGEEHSIKPKGGFKPRPTPRFRMPGPWFMLPPCIYGPEFCSGADPNLASCPTDGGPNSDPQLASNN